MSTEEDRKNLSTAREAAAIASHLVSQLQQRILLRSIEDQDLTMLTKLSVLNSKLVEMVIFYDPLAERAARARKMKSRARYPP